MQITAKNAWKYISFIAKSDMACIIGWWSLDYSVRMDGNPLDLFIKTNIIFAKTAYAIRQDDWKPLFLKT
jgi:hypothetical protein